MVWFYAGDTSFSNLVWACKFVLRQRFAPDRFALILNR